MQSKLDHALALAAQGFRVFPIIANGRTPVVKDWQRKATRDAATINRHWQRNPHDNIGIAGGHGLVILDVDVKNGHHGPRSLMGLELENDDLPATPMSRTPSGGRHLFFYTDKDVANSASKIGDGLDIRGDGGYVVAPGSTIDDKQYAWDLHADATIASAPEWLINLAGASRSRGKDAPATVGELDTEQAIARAAAYLKTADPANQGDAGDERTYKVAAKVMDFGCSAEMTLDLMLEHWNERCSPPWQPDELQQKIDNAARYRQEPQGSKNPEAEFEPVDPTTLKGPTSEGAAADRPALTAMPLEPFGEDDIEPPQWQWGSWAAKGYCTLLVAAPGVGKTNLAIAAAIAKAAGRDDITGRPMHGRGNAWILSGEDSVRDLKARIIACMKQHSVTWEDLGGRLFINSAQDQKIVVAKLIDGKTVKAVDAKAIYEACVLNHIDLLVFDPLVEFHTANENDNGQMAEVAGLIRRIAWEANVAAIIVHHTRKHDKASSEGQEGDQDSARGARALTGSSRIVITLTSMSEKRAKDHGVPDQDRHRYVGIDVAKNNLAPRGGRTAWFEQVGVAIGQQGYEVGAITPADIEPLQQSDGDAATIGVLAMEGLLAKAGPGNWTAIGTAVDHVMAADAFFAGKAEQLVRRRVRGALDQLFDDQAGVEIGSVPGEKWRVEREGDTPRATRYRVVNCRDLS